jgi:hypothetical protein
VGCGGHGDAARGAGTSSTSGSTSGASSIGQSTGTSGASTGASSSRADGGGPVDASPASGDAASNRDAAADASARDAGAEDAGATSGGDGGAASQGPASFHCVNWADARDNFVDGLLQPSGLDSANDGYATVVLKADAILSAFQTDLEANAVRVPINEPTVSATWWAAYKGIIDAAVARGMKVVVAYWAFHNGKPDSVPAYDAMWQVVVDAYASNPLVYFDIHNEPFGYSSAAWLTFAEDWLGKFPAVPKDHVIVAGTGYDQDVTPVGADTKLDGTLLSVHIYTFFSTSTTTAAAWKSYVDSHVGSYAARTVATEWGSPMTTGTNYDVKTDDDSFVSYMNGVPDELRGLGMGSCFWPGLRNGDAWSITTLAGTGTNLSLSVTNASGLDRIHWAWSL